VEAVQGDGVGGGASCLAMAHETSGDPWVRALRSPLIAAEDPAGDLMELLDAVLAHLEADLPL
jgi:hypothetical protein